MHVPTMLFTVLGVAVAYLVYARRWRLPFRRRQNTRRHVRRLSYGDISPVPGSSPRSTLADLAPNVALSLMKTVVIALGIVLHAIAVLGTVLLTPVLVFRKKRRIQELRLRDCSATASVSGANPDRFAFEYVRRGSDSPQNSSSSASEGDEGLVLENLKQSVSESRFPALFSTLMVPEFAVAARRQIERSLGAMGSCTEKTFVRRKTLILDLDETLIHSQCAIPKEWDFRLRVVIDRTPTVFYVSKRPFLDVFLQTAAMWYDLAIYTASLQRYADPLISNLDPNGLIKKRLFRSSCRKHAGNFVKDVSLIESDLRDVIIIDNSPSAYSLNDANAIPIEPWYDDRNDEELLNLLPLLHAIAFLQDVRSLLSLRLTNGMLAARRPSRRSSLSPPSTSNQSNG